MALCAAIAPSGRIGVPGQATSSAGRALADSTTGGASLPQAATRARGDPGTGDRRLGLVLPSGAQPQLRQQLMLGSANYPASVDLSQWAPPVGNQGQVGSCAAWALGYYLRGWYANKYGNYPAASPGGFSAMFVYNLATGGQDNGSTFEGDLGRAAVVWYRHSCRLHAGRLRLCGSADCVRGTECFAVQDSELDQYIRWIHHGRLDQAAPVRR